MRVAVVAGARPNFMKVAPILEAMRGSRLEPVFVHTGQHYDFEMSQAFFDGLQLPSPDASLGVGAGSHAEQTGGVMVGFERFLREHPVELVIVVGDVNSTVACALVASKAGIDVAHVEAGLRSFDRSMPEEVNRIVTDRLSAFLFTPSADADENLRREGAEPASIHQVGNVMIDTLVRFEERCRTSAYVGSLGLEDDRPVVLVTLHRPATVDDPDRLQAVIESLDGLGSEMQVVFPVHPRTRERLAGLGLSTEQVRLLDPVPYEAFIALELRADVVLTDSGGIQEETTFLGVPCLTFRSNTERPITIASGTNELIGTDPSSIDASVRGALARGRRERADLPGWDGHAAERIVKILEEAG